MGGTDLSLLPGRGQALQESIKGFGTSSKVGSLASSKCSKVLLHGTDLFEEAQRVKLC